MSGFTGPVLAERGTEVQPYMRHPPRVAIAKTDERRRADTDSFPRSNYIDNRPDSIFCANQARRRARQAAVRVNSSCRVAPEYNHPAVAQKLSQQYSRP